MHNGPRLGQEVGQAIARVVADEQARVEHHAQLMTPRQRKGGATGSGQEEHGG